KASLDRATAAAPLHMLSAWCSDHGGLVMGQIKTDTKSNEITAIPELLHLLAIKGCIVTIDAHENFFDAFDDSHSRTVRRRVWTITDLAALPELAKWPDLQAVIVVETIRAAYPGAPITSDYRVYISSLLRSATVFVAMIRQHWDIENKLHWSL